MDLEQVGSRCLEQLSLHSGVFSDQYIIHFLNIALIYLDKTEWKEMSSLLTKKQNVANTTVISYVFAPFI